MKLLKILLALSIATAASQAIAATATFNITATIIQALAVSKTADMNFGSIASPTTATAFPLPAGSEAVFTVTGQPSTHVTPSVGSASIALACNTAVTASCTGAPNMTVNAFTFANDLPAAGANLPVGGSFTNARLSATLNIGANQLAGQYTGTNTYVVIYA